MKVCILVLVMLGAQQLGRAADYAPPRPVAASPVSSVSKTNDLRPEVRGEYEQLKRTELELTLRIAVLTELAEEHDKKSEALRATQSEKAQWETALVHDLRDRIAAAGKDLSATTRRASELEQANGPISGTNSVSAMFSVLGTPTADEMAYITFLQERLGRVQQD